MESSRFNKISTIYQLRGHTDYIGEPVSQLEHALQCAYFALRYIQVQNLEGTPVEHSTWGIIISALCHDIGHLIKIEDFDNPDQIINLDMNTNVNTSVSKLEDMVDRDNKSWGRSGHEIIGAKFMDELGFSKTVSNLIKGHVEAKRYLVTTNEEYYNRLSEASKTTLTFQGGLLTEFEVTEFNSDPLANLKLKMREWDESSKMTHQRYGPVDIVEHLQKGTIPDIIPDLLSYKQIIDGQ